MLKMKRMLFASVLFALGLASCGSNVGNQTYNCCVNRQFFVCPDQDTFTTCFNDGDAKDCMRDPTKDVGCPVSY